MVTVFINEMELPYSKQETSHKLNRNVTKVASSSPIVTGTRWHTVIISEFSNIVFFV